MRCTWCASFCGEVWCLDGLSPYAQGFVGQIFDESEIEHLDEVLLAVLFAQHEV